MAERPPQNTNPGEADAGMKVCGVDRQLVERFLALIRDNYKKADRSTAFLEEVAGKTHTVTIANLRDALSHLATMLDPATPPEQWEAQIVSAEEHFRRAIQEPYAIAIGHLRERSKPVYRRYVEILPEIEEAQKAGLFAGAPSLDIVQVRRRNISQLAAAGRAAKRHNRIDQEWDAGVESFTQAFDQLDRLMNELSGHVHAYESWKESRGNRPLTIAGVIGTIVFGVVAILLWLFPRAS